MWRTIEYGAASKEQVVMVAGSCLEIGRSFAYNMAIEGVKASISAKGENKLKPDCLQNSILKEDGSALQECCDLSG
jgi:NADP-dependent 3-hydroxy acid dehydrogenase YdfG